MTPRLIRTAATALTVAVALAVAPGAFAASEQGDAGDLRASAQDLGDGAPTRIFGSFTNAEDADLYRICLANGTSFSASTVGTTTLDTQMFLFDSDGFGVYANDDWEEHRGSRLPANHEFSPTRGGEYYLGISSFNRDPYSTQGEIFQDSFNPFSYPDEVLDANGFGSAEPLSAWDGRAPGGPGLYMISLTGTSVCVPPDETPPVVTIASPVDGARVPRGANVVVDFTCTDEGGSGLASCEGTTADGAALDTSALGDVSVTVTARDGEGNETVRTHTVTVVDETAPQITLNTPAQGAVYPLGQTVTASFTCADEAGGSGLATCTGTVPNGAAVDTSSIGEKTFTVQASDAAGNPASRTVSYTVSDVLAPAIAIAAPVDGATYKLGQQVLAAYGCEDQAGGSGVATCEGTVANGSQIDTSELGVHSFVVNSVDGAGNATSKAVTYTVGWNFHGFLWPVQNPPKVNRWKAGVPVPIRFSLDGFQGAHPEAAGFPRSVSCGAAGAGVQVARGSKRRPVFHYERRSDRYVMLWKTERRWAGTCREFVLKLDDGSVHTARFEFAKRTKRDRDDGDDDDG